MSGLKKVFIIFTVAIALATVSNVFLSKADATSEEPTNTTNNVVNEVVNTTNNTNTTPQNTAPANTQTPTTDANATNNTNVANNTVNNTNVATNTENVVDWSKIRNTLPVGSTSSSGTLPKTGSNFTLKNTFLGIVVIATVLLAGITVYNKKVGMTDETKR